MSGELGEGAVTGTMSIMWEPGQKSGTWTFVGTSMLNNYDTNTINSQGTWEENQKEERRKRKRIVFRVMSLRVKREFLLETATYLASGSAQSSCSAAISLNSSKASGLASDVTFLIARPWMTSRTASSEILPLLVRGMSVTCTILAGT